jgi:hypothetical protein
MFTAPMAAVEALLELPSLHVMIEDLVGIHRLKYSEPCKPRVLGYR